MEGVGSSRLGRTSSRYGTSPASTTPNPAFSGPVRKWRKQWVSSEPPTTDNATGGKKGKHSQQRKKETKPLVLCRWTPVPSTLSGHSDLRPKRKVRYAPVSLLEELKKEACKEAGVDAKVTESEAKHTVRSDIPFRKSQNSDSFLQDMKELMMEQAELNKRSPYLQLFFDKHGLPQGEENK